MAIAAQILEYLKVFLSPQVVAGLVVVLFLKWNRKALEGLIRGIASLKVAGAEISTRDQAPSPQQETVPVVNEPPTLPAGVHLSPEQAKEVEDFVKSEQRNAMLWEFRYLSLFLVPHTHLVLEWVANSPQRISLSFYDSFWLPHIPDANQRRTIIEVLEAHHLIEAGKTGLFTVTPKGSEYLSWREATLPSVPEAP